MCFADVVVILGQGSICDGNRDSSMGTVLLLNFKEKDPVLPGMTVVSSSNYQ